MLTGSVTGLGRLDNILAQLQRVQRLDLRPLAQQIATIVEQDNAAGLLAGIDADGHSMAPLAASTQKHRAGSGPPGVPDFASSSLIAGFRVDVRITAAGVEIIGSYQDGTKARLFSEGTGRQPPRKLQGIRPQTQARIVAAVNQFAQTVSST